MGFFGTFFTVLALSFLVIFLIKALNKAKRTRHRNVRISGKGD